MSIKGKITNIIDQRIKLFGNYQTNISQTAAQNNSNINPAECSGFDPKTGTISVKSNGKTITKVQARGSAIGPGVVGFLVGNNTFIT